MEEILKEKIKETLKRRNEYLKVKGIELNNSLFSTRKKLKEENEKIFEEIKDIDREIKSLESVIKNSSDLASSLIKPVKQREKCIENMSNVKQILETENNLKSILQQLKKEGLDIENKISLLLKANELIKPNISAFDNYKDLIINASRDVINFLMGLYEAKIQEINEGITPFNIANIANSIKNEDNKNKKTCKFTGKDLNINLIALDKTCILIYKLNQDNNFMENYFDKIIGFFVKIISKNNLEDFSEELNNINKKNNLTFESLKIMVNTINQIISKVFLKIASTINERKNTYYKIFSNLNLVNIMITSFFTNMEKHLEKFFGILYKIIDNFNKVDPEGNELDYICSEISSLISSFEKFKFFISILHEKIHLLSVRNSKTNLEELSKYKNKMNIFSKKFEGFLYDLGEKYTKYEINLIKIKLNKIFKENSKNFLSLIENNIKNNYDELAFEVFVPIDDFFYILKISGNRAIETLNLQICMAILNNIKSILLDELLEIFDNQTSAALVKSEFKGKKLLQQFDFKYICKEDPCLANKNKIGNLFLIISFNLIDQSKNNLSILFEEFKIYLSENIFDSEIFDIQNILLIGNEEELIINEQIKYFQKSEIDLINHLFSEIDQLGQSYEDFLIKRIKLLFEFLHPQIKSTAEMMNSSNYILDSAKINSVDFSETFSNKFIEETDRLLLQWKLQFSENNFNKFLNFYCDYLSQFIEIILILKKYNNFGAIILEKVIIIIIIFLFFFLYFLIFFLSFNFLIFHFIGC
jgi:hypothetical protein